MEAFASVVILGAISSYLLIDGRRFYEWILAFFPLPTRLKLEQTAEEVGPLLAFVVGQLISAGLCAVYVFICLKLLGVPAAVLLAVLAGLFDILPLIGFFLTLVPCADFCAHRFPRDGTRRRVAFGFFYHGIEKLFSHSNHLRFKTESFRSGRAFVDSDRRQRGRRHRRDHYTSDRGFLPDYRKNLAQSVFWPRGDRKTRTDRRE